MKLKERSEEMDPTEKVGFGLFSGINWRRVGGGKQVSEWWSSFKQLSRAGCVRPGWTRLSF